MESDYTHESTRNDDVVVILTRPKAEKSTVFFFFFSLTRKYYTIIIITYSGCTQIHAHTYTYKHMNVYVPSEIFRLMVLTIVDGLLLWTRNKRTISRDKLWTRHLASSIRLKVDRMKKKQTKIVKRNEWIILHYATVSNTVLKNKKKLSFDWLFIGTSQRHVLPMIRIE